MVFNISKETTWLEMVAIQGFSELQRREFGINISGGVSNAIELSMEAYGLPSPEELYRMYEEDIKVI